VPISPDGTAELDVPLNDSITGFRLTAVANAGTGHFGTGETTIRTTQDLALHSALPPVAREGDSLSAIVTARNASERALTIEVSASAVGEPGARAISGLNPQTITLEASEAREMSWPIEVPASIERLVWNLSATERTAGGALDALKITQTVTPPIPVRVQQTRLIHVDQPIRVAIERPADALPGLGGLRVALHSQLGDGGDGVRDYMRDYPYSCLEQRISRAVALRDRTQWDGLMAQLPGFLDGDGLLKYFPGEQLQGSDTLTAYVLSIADETGWPLPAEVKTRSIGALTSLVDGRLARRSPTPSADRVLRKLSAIEALARHGAARATMLDAITIEPNL
jgi:hypothetical protein